MGTSPKGHTYNAGGEGTPLLNGPTEFGDTYPECTIFTTASVKECAKGDLIFCVRGSTTGRMNWADKVYSLGRGVCAIRGETDLDTKFIRYCLDYRLAGLLQLAGGTTFPNLPQDRIKDFEIPYPASRKQITEILSAYDDLIENNRRRMALLEEAARLLYREWFIHLRFPGHEHTRLIDGMPEGWERTTLEEACVPDDGIQTGPFGSQLHEADYSEEGIPVVMPKDIISSRISIDSIARVPEAIRDRLFRHVLRVGDIVLARRGDIGRKAFVGEREVGWMCGTGCMRLRPRHDYVIPRVLFDTLGRSDVMGVIAGRAQGAIMPNLNLSIMADIALVLPPMRLQRLYIDHVAPIHEMVAVLGRQTEKLRAARDLLLPRLMSGEVAV